jgi:hypothetical protein
MSLADLEALIQKTEATVATAKKYGRKASPSPTPSLPDLHVIGICRQIHTHNCLKCKSSQPILSLFLVLETPDHKTRSFRALTSPSSIQLSLPVLSNLPSTHTDRSYCFNCVEFI